MNFISRIIKSINAMRERLKIERHEAMYGPHFNEECALKAVSKMENEDGSRGEHWSLEETTSIANQYGINLKGEKYNKYDWYVALNMIRSDYYRAVVTMTSSDHIKYFVELAKAWLNDKDIEEGKMWYYYCYIMCDKLRKEAKTMLMLEDDEDEEDYEFEPRISPSNATNQTLKWTSSNKKVVKVDEDGYVYIVDAGKAVITAMATDGSGVKAKCTVTVIDDEDDDE